MKYIIHYDVAALAILIVTLIMFSFKKKLSDSNSKLFGLLAWVSLAATAFDLLGTVLPVSAIGKEMSFALHMGYYFTHTAIPFVCALYILSVTNILPTLSGAGKMAYLLPEAVNVVLIFANPFTKMYFYIDAAGNYCRGSYQFIAYIISVYYLVMLGFNVIRNQKVLSHTVVISVCCFIAMSMLSVLIQLLNPRILIESFGCALCILIIMFTLQSQNDIIENETHMLNGSMLRKNLDVDFSGGQKISMLVIKVPEFKSNLDTFSDNVLRRLKETFAEYLYSFVNFGDAYYIGDECFVLIARRDFDKLNGFYGEISARLEKSWHIGEQGTYISADILRIDIPGDASDLETVMDYINLLKASEFKEKKLLRCLDIRPYDQKRRRDVEIAIENAIRSNGLWVCYQPIYQELTKRIVSCEALVRIDDPRLGTIYPDEFIPIAERNGKIIEISRFVFEEACRFITDSQSEETGIDFVQVNLSAVQCMQVGLMDELRAVMDKYGVKPEQICLEITETASAYIPGIMEKNIKDITESGIMLALDDFGTGFSNINYLLKFPFRFIKLEKGIVWASFKDKKAHIALESTIAMIKKLNMEIIAEGVETVAQAEKLLEYHCDYLQGYLFSRPVVKDDFFLKLDEIESDFLA